MDSRNEAAFLFATQLVTASSFRAALKAAVELDLFELIKKSAGALLSPADLAAQLPTTNPAAPDMLDRILRLLAANSILKCSIKTLPNGGVERRYSLEPVCEFLTKNEDGVSLAPLLLLDEDKVFEASGDKLKDAVLDGGIPFHKAHGMGAYDRKDSRFNSIFNEAMSNHSTLLVKKILEVYDGFDGLKSIVDVGGGTGATLNMIISKYPSIKGVNFDLGHVIERAPPHAGVEHVAGDMFVSVPKGDAVFMKWICHNWRDEECFKLLKNCRDAIPDTGKVILVELILPSVLDEQLANKSVLQLDVAMMTHIEGGRQRTEMEFQALAKGAGFRGFRKACRAYNFWIMELEK